MIWSILVFVFKLRIVMCRVQIPAPFIDEDLRPHLKVSISKKKRQIFFSNVTFQDHFLNHRFDPITQKLDLTNLADDEGTNLHLSNIFQTISFRIKFIGYFTSNE